MSASPRTPAADRRPAEGASEDARRRYDELVTASRQGSLFARSWWLDAVAGGSWRMHEVERDGVVVAAWPTVARVTRLGTVHVGAPLTPYLGPLLRGGEGAHGRSQELEQVELLVARLGRYAHLEATCSPGFDYWTPLQWHGFEQTTRHTWRLPDLSDPEAVFAGLRQNVRYDVRKARKRGIAVEEGRLEDYVQLHDATAERHGRLAAARAARDALERVDAAAGTRGAREILLARDGDGRLHAGGYFVRDERWAYYLLGGADPELRASGATSLVLWTAIERAAERGIGLDFEGSMLRPVERFFRAFGGEPAAYSIVRRTPSRAFAAVRAAKRAARSLSARAARR